MADKIADRSQESFFPEENKHELMCKHGYKFDEVVSSMQKCIRRNQEYDAVYWAYILYESGYSKYLKKRIAVVINDDIGAANPQLLQFAFLLRQDAIGKKTDAKDEKATVDLDNFLPLANIIIMCCRSVKSRIAPDLTCMIQEDIKNNQLLVIPEIAIDPHTAAGKVKYGRWNDGTPQEVKHRYVKWFDEWAKIENEADQNLFFNPYKKQYEERYRR